MPVIEPVPVGGGVVVIGMAPKFRPLATWPLVSVTVWYPPVGVE
jgi:hypothetical protein